MLPLVIEIDGSQHYEEKGIKKDLLRDTYLNTLALNVLRFDNHQVISALSNVLDEIFEYVEKYLRNPPARATHARPPFAKGVNFSVFYNKLFWQYMRNLVSVQYLKVYNFVDLKNR